MCDEAFANFPFKNNINCEKCKTKFQLRCLKCNVKCETSSAMKYHLNYKCEPSEELFECSKCNKKLYNDFCLKKHEEHCGQEPNLFCEHCSFKTKYRGSLIVHLQLHLKISDKMAISNPSKHIQNENQSGKLYCICDASDIEIHRNSKVIFDNSRRYKFIQTILLQVRRIIC